MPALWPKQKELIDKVYGAWGNGSRNVLAVSPTGSGKTVMFSYALQNYKGASVAIAHRQELITQMSLALARNNVPHRVIGNQSLPRLITQLHMQECGMSYYDPSGRCAVAGIDTLVRMEANDPFFNQVGLGIGDEAHHFLRKNKWGKGVAMFPNAYWLGVTATATRADGNGLGAHADGIFDTIVEGPSMRELINTGYLTDYRIFAPLSDINLSNVPIGASGDFSQEPLRKAVHGSHIVGDIVEQYKRLAMGKLGVTFSVDIESATEQAAAYNQAGVAAAVISSKTPDSVRLQLLRRFANRDFLQLVNVDLFGEGFDLPAIECVSFGRPTQSYGLFIQQFGRALRLMITPELMQRWHLLTDIDRLYHIAHSLKQNAIIIDHVDNVHRHGLPDKYRQWSLDRRERRTRSAQETIFPVKTCVKCVSVYEAYMTACPYCGFKPIPAGRSLPEQVEGDLYELSPETLARLRGETNPPLLVPYGATPEIAGAIARRHRERMEAQAALIQTMNRWGGIWTYGTGETINEAQRRFYFKFGIDVATAQTLPRSESESLRERIEKDIAV